MVSRTKDYPYSYVEVIFVMLMPQTGARKWCASQNRHSDWQLHC